jgi:hypothetical protein
MLSGSRRTMSGPLAGSLDVLNTRVRDAQGIEAVPPGFKSAEVVHTKGDVVESHPALVKGRRIAPGMHHSCDNQPARVRHRPRAKSACPHSARSLKSITSCHQRTARSPSVTVKSRYPRPIIAGFVIAGFCRSDAVGRHVSAAVQRPATAAIRPATSAATARTVGSSAAK